MKRRIVLIATALLVAALPLSAASAGSAQPIYRVDSVTVKPVTSRTLSIEAKGAVRSGGWEKPMLRVQNTTQGNPKTVTIVFVALPPPPSAMVIQAMLPVVAKVTVPMARNTITIVKIAAESNSKTLKVVR